MKIVFATNNNYKLKEVRKAIGHLYDIVSLADIGYTKDIPEPHETLEENALEKARVIHQHFNIDCFSEDTGLEIDALNGEPGVYSARYAGASRSSENNMQLVLDNLADKDSRKAQFRTVVALILGQKEYLFEGIVRGEILLTKRGEEGFGYDPIFMPDGFDRSFAQMTDEEKNEISHRGRAVRKLIAFLDK